MRNKAKLRSKQAEYERTPKGKARAKRYYEDRKRLIKIVRSLGLDKTADYLEGK